METTMQEKPIISDAADECCPKFEPSLWNEVEHEWQNKLFLKDTVPEIFHFPVPGTYSKAITRMWKKAEDAGAAPDRKDFLLLAYDPSPFKGELFMSITKEVPGAENVRLSGTFVSKVFDGPYHKVPGYIKEMDQYLKANNKVATKYYFSFAYCPKCSKKYGHNYIVALAEVTKVHAHVDSAVL
jgi:hypothetical protein